MNEAKSLLGGKQMYRNVLLATDLSEVSENALLIALNTARRFGARLLILHALESPYVLHRGLVGDRLTGKLRQANQEYIADVRQSLERNLVDKLEGFQDYAVDVREGVPFVEILKMARKIAADLIVMGPHTGRAEERGMMRAGSTLMHVCAKARCPVMIVGRLDWRGIRDSYERVLCATEFSPASHAAVKLGQMVAGAYGARLSLFHALATSPLLEQSYGSQDRIEERLKAARDLIKERYGPELASFGGWDGACWEGVPFVEILKYAREGGADLIVMGAHVETDAERPGSTVTEVGLRAGCPVMVVR
jgi:nucleotide-binding universal stress UspA family protein